MTPRTRPRTRAVLLLLAMLLLTATAVAAPRAGPPAPEGTYDDRAKLIGEAASILRTRQDFLMRASGCPLYIVTLPSTGGTSPRDRAAELFHRWHAEDRVLPDETMLLVAFAAEKTGALVLGPAVPKEYEEALADMPPLEWADAASAGKVIDRFVFDVDVKLEAPAVRLKRRRAYFIPPVPRTFLFDGAGRFAATERAQMESELAALAKSSGHTVIAVIDPPGLTYALGAFESVSIAQWTREAFAQWRRDRPELENGAVMFAFTSTFGGAIAFGKSVEGKVPKSVRADLEREMADDQTRTNFPHAIVRVASTLDDRFAGKMTISTRSIWWYLLHPWRAFVGPDEETPVFFQVATVCLFLYFLGWALWLVITHPKIVLAQVAGMLVGGLIGGVVAQFAGKAIGEAAGKFVGGFGSSGGGGSSGSW